MTRPIRTALIGCGAIAEQGHLPALLAHPDFHVVGLCDPHVEPRARLARQVPSVRQVADYRELLDEAEAFVLAVHPEISVAIAMDLLTHGKHVLDEKPLANSLADAERLQAAVEASSAIYQVGFVFRYSAFAEQLAELIGQLGNPVSASIRIFDERLDPRDAAHRARIEGILQHSSAITHEGSHFIDLARQWNRTPFTSVHATAVRTTPGLPGPNVWHANLQHADGAMLHLTIGWLLPTLPQSSVHAVGPHGWLHALPAGGAAQYHLHGQSQPHTLPQMCQHWAGQLNHFARAIETGRTSGATFEDGYAALTTTLACEAATGILREKGP
ncbi:Gfo/Idh/MocA family protein [Phycisphaerales bacterium AB-hyl4]|uniref:Gfo/Idh/MocA family protein n=1 Tax=Natronomicrosphaera hydrolytica TaxID=3242702 RepID=A0ABV4U9M4_9BACT